MSDSEESSVDEVLQGCREDGRAVSTILRTARVNWEEVGVLELPSFGVKMPSRFRKRRLLQTRYSCGDWQESVLMVNRPKVVGRLINHMQRVLALPGFVMRSAPSPCISQSCSQVVDDRTVSSVELPSFQCHCGSNLTFTVTGGPPTGEHSCSSNFTLTVTAEPLTSDAPSAAEAEGLVEVTSDAATNVSGCSSQTLRRSDPGKREPTPPPKRARKDSTSSQQEARECPNMDPTTADMPPVSAGREVTATRPEDEPVIAEKSLFVTGPPGIGLSHILFLAATRHREDQSRYRVVYIGDCGAWRTDRPNHRYWRLCTAIVMAFHDDQVLYERIQEYWSRTTEPSFDHSAEFKELLDQTQAHCKESGLTALWFFDEYKALDQVHNYGPFDVIHALKKYSCFRVVVCGSTARSGVFHLPAGPHLDSQEFLFYRIDEPFDDAETGLFLKYFYGLHPSVSCRVREENRVCEHDDEELQAFETAVDEPEAAEARSSQTSGSPVIQLHSTRLIPTLCRAIGGHPLLLTRACDAIWQARSPLDELPIVIQQLQTEVAATHGVVVQQLVKLHGPAGGPAALRRLALSVYIAARGLSPTRLAVPPVLDWLHLRRVPPADGPQPLRFVSPIAEAALMEFHFPGNAARQYDIFADLLEAEGPTPGTLGELALVDPLSPLRRLRCAALKLPCVEAIPRGLVAAHATLAYRQRTLIRESLRGLELPGCLELRQKGCYRVRRQTARTTAEGEGALPGGLAQQRVSGEPDPEGRANAVFLQIWPALEESGVSLLGRRGPQFRFEVEAVMAPGLDSSCWGEPRQEAGLPRLLSRLPFSFVGQLAQIDQYRRQKHELWPQAAVDDPSDIPARRNWLLLMPYSDPMHMIDCVLVSQAEVIPITNGGEGSDSQGDTTVGSDISACEMDIEACVPAKDIPLSKTAVPRTEPTVRSGSEAPGTKPDVPPKLTFAVFPAGETSESARATPAVAAAAASAKAFWQITGTALARGAPEVTEEVTEDADTASNTSDSVAGGHALLTIWTAIHFSTGCFRGSPDDLCYTLLTHIKELEAAAAMSVLESEEAEVPSRIDGLEQLPPRVVFYFVGRSQDECDALATLVHRNQFNIISRVIFVASLEEMELFEDIFGPEIRRRH